MQFTLAILWHERRRFAPAVFAVAFSALLVALQGGLLLGTFSTVSIPIDHSDADLWIGDRKILSVDMGRTIPVGWQSRLCLPEIKQSEPYVQGFANWRKPSGAVEMVIVVGSAQHPGALGLMEPLAELPRGLLQESGAVVIDEADCDRLGIDGINTPVEINGHRMRVAGMVSGLRGLAGPYVFCSLAAARALLGLREDQATYLLARCREPGDAERVRDDLRRKYGQEMSIQTPREFSRQSQLHWLVRTGGGIALLCAAILALLVGTVVTRQTLYAATLASLREYAVLRALGTPRCLLSASMLFQAFCVGIAGVLAALPAIAGLAWSLQQIGGRVLLPGWLLGSTTVLMLGVAMMAGGGALRCLRQAEPITLLR